MRQQQTQKRSWWVKPFCWGAVCGAVVIMILGFAWWGWVLGSTARTMAAERADAAVAVLLAPACVDYFIQHKDKLAEFRKTSSWQQRQVVEQSGRATTPGSDKPNPAVVTACIEALERIKS